MVKKGKSIKKNEVYLLKTICKNAIIGVYGKMSKFLPNYIIITQLPRSLVIVQFKHKVVSGIILNY